MRKPPYLYGTHQRQRGEAWWMQMSARIFILLAINIDGRTAESESKETCKMRNADLQPSINRRTAGAAPKRHSSLTVISPLNLRGEPRWTSAAGR